MQANVTYETMHDHFGHHVRRGAKRRCLVLRFVNSQLAWVCGTFATMEAAERRAAELNATAEREG